MGDALKQQLVVLLEEQKQGLTTHECAERLDVDRHTLAKYLESLRGEGLVEYRQVGKAKLWSVTSSPLLTLLSKNDPLGRSIKELFNQLDEKILLVTRDRKVVWSNVHATSAQGARCFENYQKSEICTGCPAEKSFKSGIKESTVLHVGTEHAAISTIPIKDHAGQTVAFLEVVKDGNTNTAH